jgi:hypothetical protein
VARGIEGGDREMAIRLGIQALMFVALVISVADNLILQKRNTELERVAAEAMATLTDLRAADRELKDADSRLENSCGELQSANDRLMKATDHLMAVCR